MRQPDRSGERRGFSARAVRRCFRKAGHDGEHWFRGYSGEGVALEVAEAPSGRRSTRRRCPVKLDYRHLTGARPDLWFGPMFCRLPRDHEGAHRIFSSPEIEHRSALVPQGQLA